jgi:LPPG:FO 2-phospho-L-lactate transferase
MKIVLLCGGIGGSKLALGLYSEFYDEELSIIVNTGDDLELLDLHVSPDLDTVMYTLAGLSNLETGWGLAGDTFQALAMLSTYGHDGWFQLGDQDLATHLMRTTLLRSGMTLTQVTERLRRMLGVSATILPMCNEPVATRVRTEAGWLAFQEYFVKRRHADTPIAVEHDRAERASLSDEVRRGLLEADCVVVAPSNPVVSIGPILSVPGMLDCLRSRRDHTIAVSPIVGGRAVSGPAAELMLAEGFEASAAGVASMYADFTSILVIDRSDEEIAPKIERAGVTPAITNTIMSDLEDKKRVARFTAQAIHRQSQP